jgi:hypothetical protein
MTKSQTLYHAGALGVLARHTRTAWTRSGLYVGRRKQVRRVVMLFFALWLLIGCGPAPTSTPDRVATEVAVMQAAAATLTAAAPPASVTATLSPSPTATATTTPTLTAALTDTIPVPLTPPPPTATEPAPPIGPSLGVFAVVDVASDDVLNVRARPGVVHPIVGTIPFYGLDVEVHAGAQEISGSWWVPVQYKSVSGWVNGRYLARQVGWVPEAVAARAAQVVMALKERDMAGLSGLVHPDNGVRFSPYTCVQAAAGGDLVFSTAQIPGLWNDPTIYHWGVYDGSGESIDLTFREYFEWFVYDVEFARPDVAGFDETVGQGNTINNIAEVYPEAVVVEYHFEGFDPQYAGMDWRSLRLVLEESGGKWYLVGIVHDEWTS